MVVVVSIHATLAGGDIFMPNNNGFSSAFLSTPPSRVATAKNSTGENSLKCFYPRHPRGWRHGVVIDPFANSNVSIHATLAGGDPVENIMPTG